MKKYIILFILLAIFIVIQADECTFEKLQVTTATKVEECLIKIPFIENVRTKTIEHLKKIYQFYVYRDISLNSMASGSPFDIRVDVDKELDSLLQVHYQKDHSFQQDVANIFLRLKDPHTVYTKPLCYGFAYFLPFTFTTDYNETSGKQEIYLTQFPVDYISLKNDYYKVFPNAEDTLKYDGWKVLQIDNQDAMTKLLQFAETEVAYSRDVQIRFNYALKEGWSIRIGLHAQIPIPKHHSYLLQNVQTGEMKTVDWHWAAKSLINSKNFEDLLKRSCGSEYKASQGPHEPDFYREYKVMDEEYTEIMNLLRPKTKKYNSINEIKPHDFISIPYPILKDKLIKYLTKSPERKKVEKKRKGTKERIVSSEGVAMHTIANGKTGILTVGTFLPSDPEDFMETVERAFITLGSKSTKMENLIVDLRGNTGGYVCLAYGLAQYLVPSLPKIAWPALDMIRTKIVDEFMGCEKSYLFMPLYNPKDNKFVGYDEPFFTVEGIERTRGGKTSLYSRLFHLQCGTAFKIDSKHSFTFTPQNLILLTDGTCGSACGFFVHLFQQNERAKVVSIGGLVSHGEKTMNVASFDGAPVFDSSVILAVLNAERSLLGCTISEIPPPMPSTATFSVSYLELYPYKPKIAAFEKWKTNDTLPVEFTKEPADFHIWRWDLFNDDEKFFLSISSYFDKCAPWEFRRNDNCSRLFEHSISGNPCINGTFDTSQCVLFDCEAGYYLNEERTKCLVAPEEDPTKIESFGEWFTKFAIKIAVIIIICLCACCCICILCCIGIGFIIYRRKSTTGRFFITTAEPLYQEFTDYNPQYTA